jgi:hypothetical protein
MPGYLHVWNPPYHIDIMLDQPSSCRLYFIYAHGLWQSGWGSDKAGKLCVSTICSIYIGHSSLGISAKYYVFSLTPCKPPLEKQWQDLGVVQATSHIALGRLTTKSASC